MASEPGTAARDAALRHLLVARVDATARTPRSHAPSSSRRPAARRSRWQTALVTGIVSTAVVAVSVAALVLSVSPHHAPATHAGRGADGHTTTSASPRPSPTPTAQLIAHAGWHVITRDELHRFVVASPTLQRDPANAGIWEEQAWLDTECMASHGYLHDPIRIARTGGSTATGSGLTPEQLRGYDDALWGDPRHAPYDWRTAGCHGRSVHETGQDDAH